MSLPPPPPPPHHPLLLDRPPPPPPPSAAEAADASHTNGTADNNETRKCRKCTTSICIGVDEALLQVEKACRFELELLEDGEDVGMVVVVEPLLQPILQNGPVCGLVALVEAGEVLGLELNGDDVLNFAVEVGVTKQGEMFSCEAMGKLAEGLIGCEVEVLDSLGEETFLKVVRNCLQGFPCLVPYDADRNHSPSVRKGHAAHWTVIHGIAMILPISTIRDVFRQEDGCNKILILRPGHNNVNQKEIDALVEKFTEEKCYVVAHQGKSYRTGIWKYKELIRSNQNLIEISPKLTAEPNLYKLCDIKEGLCSKLLLLGRK